MLLRSIALSWCHEDEDIEDVPIAIFLERSCGCTRYKFVMGKGRSLRRNHHQEGTTGEILQIGKGRQSFQSYRKRKERHIVMEQMAITIVRNGRSNAEKQRSIDSIHILTNRVGEQWEKKKDPRRKDYPNTKGKTNIIRSHHSHT